MGADTFIFAAGALATILDYDPTVDIIDLSAFHFGDCDSLLAAIERLHGDLYILEGDTPIRLLDTSKTKLQADHFLL